MQILLTLDESEKLGPIDPIDDITGTEIDFYDMMLLQLQRFPLLRGTVCEGEGRSIP